MRALTAAIILMTSVTVPVSPGWAGDYSPRTNYILHCSGCHRDDGMGTVIGGIPAFPGSVGYIAGSDLGRTYMLHVPGVISNNLSDAEVAGVLNYILDNWGGDSPHFTTAEVTRRRAEPVADVVVFRRSVVAELKRSGIEIAEYPWP